MPNLEDVHINGLCFDMVVDANSSELMFRMKNYSSDIIKLPSHYGDCKDYYNSHKYGMFPVALSPLLETSIKPHEIIGINIHSKSLKFFDKIPHFTDKDIITLEYNRLFYLRMEYVNDSWKVLKSINFAEPPQSIQDHIISVVRCSPLFDEYFNLFLTNFHVEINSQSFCYNDIYMTYNVVANEKFTNLDNDIMVHVVLYDEHLNILKKDDYGRILKNSFRGSQQLKVTFNCLKYDILSEISMIRIYPVKK